MNAVVLVSGGQDSATCLAIASDRYGSDDILALSFDYGQKHERELDSAYRMTHLLGIKHEIHSLPPIFDVRSSLLGGKKIDGTLPHSFVPGRNLVFLTLAAAVAAANDCNQIITGVCQTDYSGYPDCRESTISALEEALQRGISKDICIIAPLMHLTKGQTVKLAMSLPYGEQLLSLSWTCYEGSETNDPFAEPCGECAACKLRAKGFLEAGIPDPALELLKKRRD
jgi:7-cyano-7-deazaguanine synthase